MNLPSFLTKTVCLATLVILGLTAGRCFALITGEHGNRPVENRGWPTGSEKVANLPSRLSYWVGPPFGGGEYHFLYRCKNTDELNEALKVFSKILTPKLELIVHDGPGRSFWLDKDEQVDWMFTVWIPRQWHSLYNNPKNVFNSDHPNFRKPVAPPRIDVYVGGGGSIVWKDVKVPPGVGVVDRRAEAAPVQLTNSGMIRGRVYDMATGQVIAGATVTLEIDKAPEGEQEPICGKTDKEGSFEIDKIPNGRYAMVVRAEGYASRRCGNYDNKGNTYHEFSTELIHDASLQGMVTDTHGKPISGVSISPRNTLAIDGRGYQSADVQASTTNVQGRFEISGLPYGFTQIRCRAPTMHLVTSIFKLYEVPARFHDPSDGITMVMEGTGVVRVTVTDKEGKPPSERIHVCIERPSGPRAGQWGGSAQCNEDGSFEFTGVPPGKYLVSANPSAMIDGTDPEAKPITVEVGKTVEVKIIQQ